MKRQLIILFTLALSSLAFGLEEGKIEESVKCVISGDPIDIEEHAKYKDGNQILKKTHQNSPPLLITNW